MNWFDIGLAIQLFLIKHESLTGFVIQLGSKVPVPEAKTVVLIRGPSNRKTTDPKSRDTLTLFVECWERDSTDSDRPDAAYKLLAQMEDLVFSAINEFGRGGQQVNGKTIRVRLEETVPDGDLFRPMVGSRTKIVITWQ